MNVGNEPKKRTPWPVATSPKEAIPRIDGADAGWSSAPERGGLEGWPAATPAQGCSGRSTAGVEEEDGGESTDAKQKNKKSKNPRPIVGPNLPI